MTCCVCLYVKLFRANRGKALFFQIMNNLFSVFDPQVLWLGFRANWVRILAVLLWVPALFWVAASQSGFVLKKILNTLAREFKANFGLVATPGHRH